MVAALVLAGSPIVILLDRGNISDSLLILLLVLAADATIRACRTGRLRSLLWAGALVGFAFQAKMLQAWLVLPALFLTYLVAAPVASFLRRAWHCGRRGRAPVGGRLPQLDVGGLSGPKIESPLCRRELQRLALHPGVQLQRDQPPQLPPRRTRRGCTRSPRGSRRLRCPPPTGLGTFGIGPSWDRLLHGPFGHDAAWLLLPAVVAAVWLFVLDRRAPRLRPAARALILWSAWLVLTFGFFSGGEFLNSYYLAALIPAVAALCGMGATAAWQRRSLPAVGAALGPAGGRHCGRHRRARALGYAGVRPWIVASAVLVGPCSLRARRLSLQGPRLRLGAVRRSGPRCARHVARLVLGVGRGGGGPARPVGLALRARRRSTHTRRKRPRSSPPTSTAL